MNRTLKQDKLMFPTVKLFKIQINVDIPTIVGLFFLTNKKSRFIGKKHNKYCHFNNTSV